MGSQLPRGVAWLSLYPLRKACSSGLNCLSSADGSNTMCVGPGTGGTSSVGGSNSAGGFECCRRIKFFPSGSGSFSGSGPVGGLSSLGGSNSVAGSSRLLESTFSGGSPSQSGGVTSVGTLGTGGTSPGSGGGSSSTTATPCSNQGVSQCNGQKVQTCISGQWQTVQSCPYGCTAVGDGASCIGNCVPGPRGCYKSPANTTPVYGPEVGYCDTTGTFVRGSAPMAVHVPFPKYPQARGLTALTTCTPGQLVAISCKQTI